MNCLQQERDSPKEMTGHLGNAEKYPKHPYEDCHDPGRFARLGFIVQVLKKGATKREIVAEGGVRQKNAAEH